MSDHSLFLNTVQARQKVTGHFVEFSNTAPCTKETNMAIARYDDLQNWLDMMSHKNPLLLCKFKLVSMLEKEWLRYSYLFHGFDVFIFGISYSGKVVGFSSRLQINTSITWSIQIQFLTEVPTLKYFNFLSEVLFTQFCGVSKYSHFFCFIVWLDDTSSKTYNEISLITIRYWFKPGLIHLFWILTYAIGFSLCEPLDLTAVIY